MISNIYCVTEEKEAGTFGEISNWSLSWTELLICFLITFICLGVFLSLASMSSFFLPFPPFFFSLVSFFNLSFFWHLRILKWNSHNIQLTIQCAVHLPILDISYKCNHIICDLFWSGFFHLTCFWGSPIFSMYEYLASVCGWIIFHCTYIPQFVYPLTDIWIVPTFWLLWTVLLWMYVYRYLFEYLFSLLFWVYTQE